MTSYADAIRIKINLNRLRVSSHGRVIAETTHGLTLLEGDKPPVHYIPSEDVNMACLDQTDRRTRSPRLGEAVHFAVSVDGHTVENAALSYHHVRPEALALHHYIAFRADKVQIVELSRSQEPWTPSTNPQGAYPAS